MTQPPAAPARTRRSVWTTLLFALFMLLLAAAGFVGSLVIGTMATDGCPSDVNDLPLLFWLLVVTPLLILFGSLVPPLLFFQGRRIRTVLLGLFVPVGAYVVAAAGYLVVLIRVCGVS